MIQAVLFDLDGTLTNTIDDIATAMNRALRLHGLPGWETKEYCYLVGNGAKILAQRAVRDRQDLADAVQAEYQAYYEKHTQVKTQPYDGIPELLQRLQQAGHIFLFHNGFTPFATGVSVSRHTSNVNYFLSNYDKNILRYNM